MTAPITGRATAAELQELHGLMVRELIKVLKRADASAEYLAVTRGVLRDFGRLGLDIEAKDRKRLETLYGLLVERLLEALSSREPWPSASMVGEARKFLQQQGITKDLDSAVDNEAALQALGSASLPFTTH